MITQYSGPPFLLPNPLFEGEDCSSLAFPKPPPQLPACTSRLLSDTDTTVRLKTPGTSLTGLGVTTGTAGQHVLRYSTEPDLQLLSIQDSTDTISRYSFYSELESFSQHLM